jgi:hypothetical protein
VEAPRARRTTAIVSQMGGGDLVPLVGGETPGPRHILAEAEAATRPGQELAICSVACVLELNGQCGHPWFLPGSTLADYSCCGAERDRRLTPVLR